MTGPVTFRPIRPEDEPFLYRLYATTRDAELALVDWDDTQKEAFLRMQFRAQHTFYLSQFTEAAFDLIVRDGDPIGRLYVDRRSDEIRIIDIALMPEQRNAGLGGALLRALLEEGARSGKPVRIHVEKFNRAMTLYQRLGFVPIHDQGVHLLMEWSPGRAETSLASHTATPTR